MYRRSLIDRLADMLEGDGILYFHIGIMVVVGTFMIIRVCAWFYYVVLN